jgi:putative hydrolase of the HAD superfamily
MKAVIFDLGNVLIHYDHRSTCTGLAAVSQVDAHTISQLLTEVGQDAGLGKIDLNDLHIFLQERAGATPDLDAFWMALCAGMARNDAALAYAAKLQERPGVAVAVISNTNDGHVLWLDEHAPELAEFDLVMMSNEVGLHKPDPEIYRLALELLDLSPAQALFIDDLPANVAGAQALGMTGIVHSDWSVTRPLIEAWLAE